MPGWFGRRAKPRSRPIEGPLWREATANWLFMRGLDAEADARLKSLAEQFLGFKHFSGTHALEITDAMQVEIAAQACILVLELGIEWYEGWSEIIVYPSQFAPERDVALAADERERVAGYNVVIHEFAHKLDMRNGDPNGFPPLHSGMSREAWKRAFSAAYEDFCKRVDAADRLPERRMQAALDALPIDPYAAEAPAEFFAVGSEAFFETPELLQPAYPAVYEQLRLFYRQDPLARLP
jgi:hypothetical protein